MHISSLHGIRVSGLKSLFSSLTDKMKTQISTVLCSTLCRSGSDAGEIAHFKPLTYFITPTTFLSQTTRGVPTELQVITASISPRHSRQGIDIKRVGCLYYFLDLRSKLPVRKVHACLSRLCCAGKVAN